MPKGHKPDCECIICVRLRTKAERERSEAPPVVPVEIPGIILGPLPIGTLFRYSNQAYRKINQLEDECVVEDATSMEVKIKNLPSNTVVEIIGVGHLVDKEPPR